MVLQMRSMLITQNKRMTERCQLIHQMVANRYFSDKETTAELTGD